MSIYLFYFLIFMWRLGHSTCSFSQKLKIIPILLWVIFWEMAKHIWMDGTVRASDPEHKHLLFLFTSRKCWSHPKKQVNLPPLFAHNQDSIYRMSDTFQSWQYPYQIACARNCKYWVFNCHSWHAISDQVQR